MKSTSKRRAVIPLAVLLTCAAVGALTFAGSDDESAKSTDKTKKHAGMSESEIREKLTPIQYRVTMENGTEPPFRNEYWDNHQPGIYVDVITGEPLFSSTDKYDSGSGWPSFTKPISESALAENTDRSYGMNRTEIRSSASDAHLGHVFPDGPRPTGLRYCVNSAALRFVPLEKLVEEGYAKFLSLFEKRKTEDEKK